MNKHPSQIDFIEFPARDVGSGFNADADHKPAHPRAVIYTADLGAGRSEVLAAGGSITRDVFAFPGGRRFHFADPDGNELAVWSEQ